MVDSKENYKFDLGVKGLKAEYKWRLTRKPNTILIHKFQNLKQLEVIFKCIIPYDNNVYNAAIHCWKIDLWQELLHEQNYMLFNPLTPRSNL